jgi:hypothetical protein
MIRAVVFAAMLAQSAEVAQPETILDSARRVGLAYARHLPDFICTEDVRRFGDWKEKGDWFQLDRLSLELAYHDGKESYRLIGRNGHPSRQPLKSLNGAFSQGEFGSVLRLIFAPESRAIFEWQRWDLSGVHRLAIFDYRVRVTNSQYVLNAGTQTVVTAFHGELAVDPETGRTLRWSVEAEPPADFPIAESVTSLEYGLRTVAGVEYLLPVRAEIVAAERKPDPDRVRRMKPELQDAASHRMRYRNIIEFRDYRKFSADTRVTF